MVRKRCHRDLSDYPVRTVRIHAGDNAGLVYFKVIQIAHRVAVLIKRFGAAFGRALRYRIFLAADCAEVDVQGLAQGVTVGIGVRFGNGKRGLQKNLARRIRYVSGTVDYRQQGSRIVEVDQKAVVHTVGGIQAGARLRKIGVVRIHVYGCTPLVGRTGNAGKGHGQIVRVAEAVVDFKFGRPSTFGNIDGRRSFKDFGRVFVQVTGKIDVLSRLCRILRTDGNNQVLRIARRIDNHFTVQIARHPALHAHTVGRVHERAVAVYTESARAGEKGFFAVF